MIRGPSFIVSTMQEETTPIFKRLWYDWTQQQPGIEPTNPLGQCWVPPIVAFYDQQGLLRTYSFLEGSIRSPHPGSPRGAREKSGKCIFTHSRTERRCIFTHLRTSLFVCSFVGLVLTPSKPVMFKGPNFIPSTMQAGTTPIFNVFGMTRPCTNRELNP